MRENPSDYEVVQMYVERAYHEKVCMTRVVPVLLSTPPEVAAAKPCRRMPLVVIAHYCRIFGVEQHRD